jgi:hypothetical protein
MTTSECFITIVHKHTSDILSLTQPFKQKSKQKKSPTTTKGSGISTPHLLDTQRRKLQHNAKLRNTEPTIHQTHAYRPTTFVISIHTYVTHVILALLRAPHLTPLTLHTVPNLPLASRYRLLHRAADLRLASPGFRTSRRV